MAEYLIHVVINRNNQKSLIVLPPQVGQLFRFDINTLIMRFLLTPSSQGQWIVEVNSLSSRLNVTLT